MRRYSCMCELFSRQKEACVLLQNRKTNVKMSIRECCKRGNIGSVVGEIETAARQSGAISAALHTAASGKPLT